MQVIVIVAEQSELAAERFFAGAIGVGMLVVFLLFFVIGLINQPKHVGLRGVRRRIDQESNVRNRKNEPIIIFEQEPIS